MKDFFRCFQMKCDRALNENDNGQNNKPENTKTNPSGDNNNWLNVFEINVKMPTGAGSRVRSHNKCDLNYYVHSGKCYTNTQ